MTRRGHGTGTLYYSEPYWIVRLSLIGGRRIQRKRYTRDDALAALAELKQEYAGQLGYYSRMPRPYRIGEQPKRQRSGVTARVRFLVLNRDHFRCVYCGTTAAESKLHVDHVLPVARGGSDDPTNLVTACELCNQGKAALLLTEDPA